MGKDCKCNPYELESEDIEWKAACNKPVSGKSYQQAVENDIEDEHPLVSVGHVQSSPKPDQGHQSKQCQHHWNLCNKQHTGHLTSHTDHGPGSTFPEIFCKMTASDVMEKAAA